MGRFALLVVIKHAAAQSAGESPTAPLSGRISHGPSRRENLPRPLSAGESPTANIKHEPRNKYEQWSDVEQYITDDYHDTISCTGFAQYCKGPRCYGRFNIGDIGCYHGNFHTEWDADDHMWCNCQPLECLDDSRFAIYDDGFGESSGCEKLVGSWQHLQSSSGDQQVTFQEGFKKTDGWSFSSTEEWSESVTESANMGIEVEGISAGMSVSTTMSHSLSETHSRSFSEEQSDSTTQSFDFAADDGTYVWQWQYDFYSPRAGTEPVTTTTADLTATAGASQPPCCLPGYGVEGSHYQECTDGPNLCESTKAEVVS